MRSRPFSATALTDGGSGAPTTVSPPGARVRAPASSSRSSATDSALRDRSVRSRSSTTPIGWSAAITVAATWATSAAATVEAPAKKARAPASSRRQNSTASAGSPSRPALPTSW